MVALLTEILAFLFEVWRQYGNDRPSITRSPLVMTGLFLSALLTYRVIVLSHEIVDMKTAIGKDKHCVKYIDIENKK